MASSSATLAEFSAYASLRLAGEYVQPDNGPGKFGDYGALRDAYSRIGAKASANIVDDWTIMAQLELPVDLANLRFQSPYDDNDDVRIFKVQVSGPLGTFWYGRGWMAYYNHIAYPVDYFSSYYSGWATLTTFRREKTFYYATPRFKGLQFAFATSGDNGTLTDRRVQYVLSYSANGLKVAIGRDDQGDDGYAINGISVSYTNGPWYIAGKYEELETTGANDGKHAANLLVQYALDKKNTIRFMIADVNAWSYGDNVFHAGWDHQFRKNVKFFVEFYYEETTAAISNKRKSTFLGSPSFNVPADSGGKAISVGARVDFSS